MWVGIQGKIGIESCVCNTSLPKKSNLLPLARECANMMRYHHKEPVWRACGGDDDDVRKRLCRRWRNFPLAVVSSFVGLRMGETGLG